MGNHVDSRKHSPKRKQKRRLNEDEGNSRFQRVSFKNYLRSLEEEELMNEDYSDVGDDIYSDENE